MMLNNGSQVGSGYTLSRIYSDTTTIPSNSGATSYAFGNNLPGGPLEYLLLRFTASVSSGAIVGDFSNCIKRVRITLNGDTVHDFNAGYANTDNNAPGLYGYLLNSIGGRFGEVPSDTAKEAFTMIPLGQVLPSGVSRIELAIDYAQTQAAVASGSFEMYGVYNTAQSQSVRLAPATSFNHTANQLEQVTVRTGPMASNEAVAAIFVQNDTAADEFGTQGLRVEAISSYGLDADLVRLLQGDLVGGVKVFDDANGAVVVNGIQVAGGLLYPCFGLRGGDIILQVDSSATTTRFYSPVIVGSIGASSKSGAQQSEPVKTTTSGAILDRIA